MKKALFTLIAILGAFSAFAQSMPNVDTVKLATDADYRAAEPVALRVSAYILSTPTDDKSIPRLHGTKFLLEWMNGTPDYTFDLDKNVIKYFEKDIDLMGVYTASLATVAIENKTVKNSKSITSLAVKKFVAYISNDSNKVDLNSKLKKMIEANQNGEL